ncbi:MAG: GNAT family N-acetyltransferase [Prevotella sp.]|nr:GNAT family N-acetyltransferase [Prevotella sp.]
MKIIPADPSQAPDIARLIMHAMNYECCLYFVGEGHTLADFERIMTSLVRSDCSQYSYRNTLVAVDTGGEVCGICVAYDGGQLHYLRRAFIKIMREECGRDFSGIADETAAGELYIDSLAVREDMRGKGIATALLRATIDRARTARMPAVGLLVDKGNPRAECLYTRLGFTYINDSAWGGHPMRHLQYRFTDETNPCSRSALTTQRHG